MGGQHGAAGWGGGLSHRITRHPHSRQRMYGCAWRGTGLAKAKCHCLGLPPEGGGGPQVSGPSRQQKHPSGYPDVKSP